MPNNSSKFRSPKEKPRIKRPSFTSRNEVSGSFRRWKYLRWNLYPKTTIVSALLACALAIYFNRWGSMLHRSSNRPYPAPLINLKDINMSSYLDRMFWGTYRPNLYFGMRHRSPESLLTGLMWYKEDELRREGPGKLRHHCNKANGISSYGWLAHDGVDFGIQYINDTAYVVRTSWVKVMEPTNSQFDKTGRNTGGWISKFEMLLTNQSQFMHPALGLMFYVTHPRRWIDKVKSSASGLDLSGHTAELGAFTLHVVASSSRYLDQPLMTLAFDDDHQVSTDTTVLRHFVENHLNAVGKGHSSYTLPVIQLGSRGASEGKTATSSTRTFLVHLVCLQYPCTMTVHFNPLATDDKKYMIHSRRDPTLDFDTLITHRVRQFDARFAKIFPAAASSPASTTYIYALSNMLGGLGYFYGRLKYRNSFEADGAFKEYFPTALFTAVPSRSAFPRGFIWDEGFHNLLIFRWNPIITMDILASYLNTMDSKGWIPREIILGREAENHVPREFIVQQTDHANPPSWLLLVDEFVSQSGNSSLAKQTAAYWVIVKPRLEAYLEWFSTTQRGIVEGSYRWRGRDPKAEHELNPKTLTSGLDDYPRASHPSKAERHLDLLCWILYSRRILRKHFGINVGNAWPDNFGVLRELEMLHLYDDGFYDYGLHSTDVVMQTFTSRNTAGDDEAHIEHKTMVRKVLREPEYQLVKEVGYVSLYPFLLQLLPPDSTRYLRNIADQLQDPDLLWSNYGIRSLCRNSTYYAKLNTEHDPPYWRGSIWIHFNYLVMRALRYYADARGSEPEMKDRFRKIYVDLRTCILSNVEREFERTGTLWEQYSDVDGKGKFSQAFTGWSALVLLIKDELF